VRHNLLANLGGRVVSVLVGLVCVPIYIRVLGIAGYGLVGVWITLETFANLIDLGLSPTLTREMAACSTRPGGAQDARDLVRTLEVGYWALGLVVGALIISCASPIATHWLHSAQLSPATLRTAIILIGILILCRWPLSFYASGLTGLERQVLLSGVGTAYAYLRSLGSIVILLFVSPTIFAFFIFQISINILQTAAFTILLWHCLPSGPKPRFRPELIRRIWRFAGVTSATTLVWLLVSQLDKFVVSAMLPLESFGYYTLGSRIATCLSVGSAPLFSSVFPAFSRQVGAGNERTLAELYHNSSQLMSVLVLPAALTVIFFANPLIFAWTGRQLIAERASLIAALLTAGSAFNCMVGVPYALQLAYGWTSLAFWSNIFALCLTVPLLLVLVSYFGAAGAAAAWLVVNISFLATYVVPMHRRLLTSEGTQWFLQDLGAPLIACTLIAALLFKEVNYSATRLTAALTVAFAGAVLGGVALLSTPFARKQIRELIAQKRVSTI
jgi:O-antigen/teichoic acid export membrane protein